jgi:hypothetical protein
VSLAPTDGETPKESAPSKTLTSQDLPAKSGDEKLAPGRVIAAIIFGLLALAFFAAGGVLAITPANQLPGFLGHANSHTHHTLRGIGSLIVGLVFTAAAWFALRYQSLALEQARAADAARQAPQPQPVAGADDSENLPAA